MEYQFRMTPQVLRAYESTIQQFIIQVGLSFDKVTKSDIRKWLTYLSTEKGFKPNTINNKIAALKLFYKYCREEGVILSDPVKEIKHVFVEDKRPRYLSKEQFTQLRSLLEGRVQERAVLEVLYATGVRISELTAMKKTDINWTERYIVIPEGKWKTGRIVLFTSECAEHLKAYLESRTDNLPVVFAVLNTDGSLENNCNVIEEWFRYYSRQLGFKVTPHTMRHTCAAQMAQRGMPVECIQALLGHDKIQTTRVYAKLFDHARKEIYNEFM
jgi:integrase/recombinase XerD